MLTRAKIMETPDKKLCRSQKDHIAFGVCGGLGDYFEVDPLIVRMIFALFLFINGIGLLFYLFLLLILPKSPNEPSPLEHGGSVHDFAHTIQEKTREFAEEVHAHSARTTTNQNSVAIIIIILGFALFIGQLLPIYWLSWNFFWPFIIIITGLVVLLKR